MVRRRMLAAELRRLRGAAKLTCEEVAALRGCPVLKISRIESGQDLPSRREVRALAAVYGVSPDQANGLVQLADRARQKGWWQGYDDALPHLVTYLGMARTACQIRHYALTRLPVMLQTPDYARAISTADSMGGHPMPTHDRLAELLTELHCHPGANPPKVWAVLDEAALRRQVGGREVMRGQIEHLIELAATPPWFVQFIPFSRGGHAGAVAPFAILSFADPADPDVVSMRYPTGRLWVEDSADVHAYNMLFDHLQATALPLRDSMRLMIDVLKDT